MSFQTISGCIAAYYADQGVTVSSTGGVSAWADQSGSGNNAAQATAANQPRYPAQGRYQAVVLDKNASAQTVLASAVSVSSQSFSVVMVADCSTSYVDQGQQSGQAYWTLGTGSNPAVMILNGDGYGSNAYGAVGTLAMYGQNVNSGFGNCGVFLPTSRHVIVITGDNGATKAYVNGTLIASGVPFSAATLTGLTIGSWSGGGNWSFKGDVYGVAVYNRALAQFDVTNLTSYAASKWGINLNPTSRICFGGDSLTAGTGATDNLNWPRQVLWDGTNADHLSFAWPGGTVVSMAQNASTFYDAVVASGRKNVFLCWAGINDLNGGSSAVTAYANYKTLLQGRKTAGYNVAVAYTMNPWTTGQFETQRQGFNSSLRSDFTVATSNPYVLKANTGIAYADYLIDVAALPCFGYGMQVNTDNFYTDNLHLSSIGYAAVAQVMQALLPMIWPSASGTVTGPVVSGATGEQTAGVSVVAGYNSTTVI